MWVSLRLSVRLGLEHPPVLLPLQSRASPPLLLPWLQVWKGQLVVVVLLLLPWLQGWKGQLVVVVLLLLLLSWLQGWKGQPLLLLLLPPLLLPSVLTMQAAR